MGYLLIRVHSFECDEPGCNAEEEHAEPTKPEAVKQLVKRGWERAGIDRFFCPKHAMTSGTALLSKRSQED